MSSLCQVFNIDAFAMKTTGRFLAMPWHELEKLGKDCIVMHSSKEWCINQAGCLSFVSEPFLDFYHSIRFYRTAVILM